MPRSQAQNRYFKKFQTQMRASQPPVSFLFRKKVQKVINKNLEKKFVINTANLVAITNTGTVPQYELNTMAQGTTQLTRVGNTIHVTGLHGEFVIQPNVNSVTSNWLYQPLIRVVLYIPKDPDDNTPVSAIGSEIDTDLYTVLHDEIFDVGFFEYGRRIKFSKSFTNGGKRRGMSVNFSGAAANTVTKNPMRLLFYSDQSLGTEQPVLSGHIKCWYTDA